MHYKQVMLNKHIVFIIL